MRKALLFAALALCLPALAQSPYIRTLGASSSNCSSPSASCLLNSIQSGSGSSLSLLSQAADGASAVGLILGTTTAYTTSGAKLVSIRNNNVEKAAFDKDGYLDTQRVMPSGTASLSLLSPVADGASAVGVVIGTTVRLANAAAKSISFVNSLAVERMWMNDANLAPTTSSSMNLGKSGNVWASVWASSVVTSGVRAGNNTSRLDLTSFSSNTHMADVIGGSASLIAHKFGNYDTQTGSGQKVFAFYNDNVTTEVLSLTKEGGLNFRELATGSLPTCNAGGAGTVASDSTLGKMVWCEGSTSTYRPVPHFLSFDGSQDPGSIAGNACANFTISATGVVDADVPFCDYPSGLEDGLTAQCNTGVDVIGWRVCNVTVLPIDPANGTYRARVLR